jgi:hypothetical protein
VCTNVIGFIRLFIKSLCGDGVRRRTPSQLAVGIASDDLVQRAWRSVDLAPAQARAALEIRDVLSEKQVQTEDLRWMPQGITNRLSLYR